MADGTVQSVTAKYVHADLDYCILRPYVVASTVNKGDACYVSTTDTVAAARANAAETSRANGIIVGVPEAGQTTAVSGDPVTVCVFGPVTGFSGLVGGTIYYVSSGAAGSIVTPAPTGAGTWTWAIGYGEDAGTLFVLPGLLTPSSNS